METGNGNGNKAEENSQEDRDDSGGGSVSVNPAGDAASIIIPLAPSPSPSPQLNASPGGMSYLIAEATRFSADIRRLSEDLAVAKQRIGVQDEELALLQDQVHQQNVQLAEAAEIMTEQQNKIADLDEEKKAFEGWDRDAKELKEMLAFERKARTDAEEKLKQMKDSMNAVTGELHEIIYGLVENVQEKDCSSARSSTPATARNWDLTPQNELARLSEFVENKFEAYAASQRETKTELTNVNAVFRKLEKVLKRKRKEQNMSTMPTNTCPPASAADTAAAAAAVVINPPQQSPSASTSQTQIKEEIAPAAKTLPGNEYHAENIARFKEGFFCICGMNYSSRSNLRTHVRTFTEDGKFKCPVCKQRFVLFYMLRRHLKDKHKIQNNKSVGCSVCGKQFGTFARLYEHRKSAHPKESKRNGSSGRPANTSSWSFYDGGDDDDITFLGAVTAATAVTATATTATTSAQPPPPPPTNSNDTDESDEIERPINYFGKRHGLDVAKIRQGFFCICGSKLLNRRKLDIHVRRSNQQDLSGGVINYNEDLYEEEEEEEDVLHGSTEFGRKKRTSNLATRNNGFNRRRGPNTQLSRERTTQVRRRPSTSSSNTNNTNRLQQRQHFPSSRPDKKFGCDRCDASFSGLNQLLRHRKGAHGIVHKGFAIGCRDCGLIFASRNKHSQHRITVHHSAFGRSKKGRLANPEENDPPMPRLRNQERRWVSTSASSPPLSPQAIPISIDGEDGAPANGDNEQPSSSAVAATLDLHEYDQEDNEEEDRDESQNDDRQRHAMDSTKADQGHFCICGADFNERKNLLCHIRRHTEKWRFHCKVCKKLFYYNSALKRHMLSTHKVKNIYTRNKRVGCVTCGATFKTLFELRQHAKNMHSSRPEADAEPQGRPSIRGGGGRGRASSSRRNRSPRQQPIVQRQEIAEQTSHGVDDSLAQRGHFCLCGKDFSSEKTLFLHVRYQTRERTVPCPICSKLFICQSYMKQHVERSHKIEMSVAVSMIKAFRCRKCPKAFNTNAKLLSHTRTAHKTNSQVAAAAAAAGVERATRTARSLAAFRQRRKNAQIPLDSNAVHEPSTEQPSSSADGHKCCCGREYLSKGALRRHIRLQVEGRIFQCQLCPREFAERASLKVHMRKTHHSNGSLA